MGTTTSRSRRGASLLLLALGPSCGQVGYVPDDDSAPDAGNEDAPVISELALAEDLALWNLVGRFQFTDPQRDLHGGLLHIGIDDRVLTELPIPSRGVQFGESEIEFALDLDDIDWSTPHTFAVQLVDAAGNWSAPLAADFSRSGTDAYELEPNDEAANPMELGPVDLPLAVRGRIEVIGEGGDADRYTFVPNQGGSVAVEVWASGEGADYDFLLLDAAGQGVSAGQAIGEASPESAQAVLSQGVTYTLVVTARSGPANTYTAAVR